MTHVPTFARDVTAATAPAIDTPSQTPRGGPSSIRHRSSSGVQMVSKPMDSARPAISRISDQRAVVMSGPNCMSGSTIPISNERTLVSSGWRAEPAW